MIAHRLVIIDPEDRDQVERIYRSWCDNLGGPDHEEQIVAMQAAFRSLITPPKPDEPTGLGAVVEDEVGRRWVRIGADDDPLDEHLRTQMSPPWRSRGMLARWWSHLPAVRVLSEGVTA